MRWIDVRGLLEACARAWLPAVSSGVLDGRFGGSGGFKYILVEFDGQNQLHSNIQGRQGVHRKYDEEIRYVTSEQPTTLDKLG